jgi:tetratricopeptide (TPR) repeat protein
MAFDKAKAVRAAEKHLSQGKITHAIQEYRRIVENDAKDVAALNTLGDLYSRANQKQEAIECFTRVAEHYRTQGFALKAIAMYKKVYRLMPDSLDVAVKLASLYEQQGLNVEARTEYVTIADSLTRAGRTRDALDVLTRVADLDPHNAAVRLRIAEGYDREGFREEAAPAFVEAGARFAAQGEHEKALDAYERALAIKPHDTAILTGWLDVHTRLGSPDEAAEKIESAAAARPGDADLLELLARAYIDSENAESAEHAVERLAALDSTKRFLFSDVVRLHVKAGDTNAALRLLEPRAEQMLSEGKEEELISLVNDILARDPDNIVALKTLVRAHVWQRNDASLRSVLERLAETAAEAGLANEERSALAELVRLAPDETEFRDRLNALGGAPDLEGDIQTSFVAPTTSFASDEVPTFESFMFETNEAAISSSEEVQSQTVSEFEWNTIEEPAPVAASEQTAASFADLNEFTDAVPSAGTEAPVASFQEAGFDISLEAQREERPADSSERIAALLAQELESVDFYLTQGYTDIARETLDMLEKQYGASPMIEERRARMGTAEPKTVEETQTEASPSVEMSNFAVYDVAASENLTTQADGAPRDNEIDNGLAAIFDEFRAAVEEEQAPPVADYETHYNLGLAYKEMDLYDDAIEEFQKAAAIVAPQDGTPRYLQCCNLLGHCFMRQELPQVAAMWFRKGLDAPGHTEDEYQALRYELATAYEQMGDLDRALKTYMEVYGIDVSYRGVSDKLRELKAKV